MDAKNYGRHIELTVDLDEEVTTRVETMQVSRQMTDQAMLLFRGTVEYQDMPSTLVDLVYDNPRILPVSLKELKGEYANYTEVAMQLGQENGAIIPFTQMYHKDSPKLAEFARAIKQLQTVDWRAALTAPLPPSGRIVHLVAPPEIQRKHKKLVNV